MRNYYLITGIIGLLFNIFLLGYGIFQAAQTGMHNAWWYFLAVLLFSVWVIRRFQAWKKSANKNLPHNPEK